MTYDGVREALGHELSDGLAVYYRDDPDVEVNIDRRAQGDAPSDRATHEDRRRERPIGSLTPIEPPAGG